MTEGQTAPPSPATDPQIRRAPAAPRLARAAATAAFDTLILVAIFLCSALAVIAVALATPVAVALSAVAGAIAKDRRRGGWRLA